MPTCPALTKCYGSVYKNPENPVSLVSVDGVQWALLTYRKLLHSF